MGMALMNWRKMDWYPPGFVRPRGHRPTPSNKVGWWWKDVEHDGEELHLIVLHSVPKRPITRGGLTEASDDDNSKCNKKIWNSFHTALFITSVKRHSYFRAWVWSKIYCKRFEFRLQEGYINKPLFNSQNKVLEREYMRFILPHRNPRSPWREEMIIHIFFIDRKKS